MRPAAFVIAVLFLPVVLAAQEPPPVSVGQMGRTTHARNPAQAAEGSSMLESVVTGAVAGGAMGFLGGFLVGGVMNIGADIESFGGGLQTSNPCVDENCAATGAAIGAAAGFVLGAAFGAVSAKRRPSNGQANVRMVPLHDGRYGVQLSVRF